MTPEMKEVGRLVRAGRASKKLTQKELADMVGVTHSTISDLENDHRNITFLSLIRIFDVLDIEYNFGGTVASERKVVKGEDDLLEELMRKIIKREGAA